MNGHATRATHRPGRILGATILTLLLAGCTAAAPSESTPTPGPTMTPSAAVTVSPLASPTAAGATGSPAASSTPAPTATTTPWSANDPCPPLPVDLATVRDVSKSGRTLECFGRRPLTFRAYVPETEGLGGVSASKMTPRWIADAWNGAIVQPGPLPEQDQDAWLVVRVPPSLGACDITDVRSGDCPFGTHVGGYLTVTGHFDDPVAATCRSRPFQAGGDAGPSKARMIARCRREFVVSAIAPAS